MTGCFETCMVVAGNVQWEVTLACSALRAPYAARINPKNTSPLSRDYWQKRQRRQTNGPKRFCPWNKSSPLWSLLLRRDAYFFWSCTFKDFKHNCFSAEHQVWFGPNLRWACALSTLQFEATHANRQNRSKWGKRLHRWDTRKKKKKNKHCKNETHSPVLLKCPGSTKSTVKIHLFQMLLHTTLCIVYRLIEPVSHYSKSLRNEIHGTTSMATFSVLAPVHQSLVASANFALWLFFSVNPEGSGSFIWLCCVCLYLHFCYPANVLWHWWSAVSSRGHLGIR